MFIELAFFGDQGAYAGQNVDLRPALGQFLEVVNQWAEKETYSSSYKLKVRQVKRSEDGGEMHGTWPKNDEK